MIEVKNLEKSFGNIKAIDRVNATIEEGHVFGLIGTNGAGKSTFMRMLSGVLKPDGGEILIDGETVYENPGSKQKLFFISDDQYFFKSGTPLDMVKLYKTFYPGFEEKKWTELMEKFGLDKNRKVNTFSKGMKKQLSVICGVCAGTDYLFCDETFDGLDPVIRLMVKKLLAEEIAERGATVMISSHNLRELEDLCDQVGLLSAGRLLFEKDLDVLKLGFCRVQAAYDHPVDWAATGLAILDKKERGKLVSLLVRGTAEDTLAVLEARRPLFAEALPMTLEEVFIGEMEAAGYDYSNILS